MPVTMKGVQEAFADLKESGYHKPSDVAFEAVAGRWFEKLSDINDSQLARAVDDYIRGGHDFWPKPGAIRSMALSANVSNFGAQEFGAGYSEHDRPCAVCGAELRWLKPHEQVNYKWNPETREFFNEAAPVLHGERYGTLHDMKAHRLAGVPCVGYWR